MTDELTTFEAAELLGVSDKRVRQFRADGRLPARRAHGRIYFAREDVERLAAVPRVEGYPRGKRREKPLAAPAAGLFDRRPVGRCPGCRRRMRLLRNGYCLACRIEALGEES